MKMKIVSRFLGPHRLSAPALHRPTRFFGPLALFLAIPRLPSDYYRDVTRQMISHWTFAYYLNHINVLNHSS